MTNTQARWAGVAGIIAAVVLFTGDMLFYYVPGHASLLENMAKVSTDRILLSTATAMLAAWGYFLAAFQVRFAFAPANPIVKNLIFLCFAFIGIAYGVVHANYSAIAISANLAEQHQLELLDSVSLAYEANHLLRAMVYPIFALLSVLFIYQVWQRKTLYPRWIILAFPLLSFLLQYLLKPLLSGTAYVVLMGGWLNLILVLFYTSSTLALWNKNVPGEAL
ncbi:hypothetical protein L2725_09445 [Shewanella corallii]|uniref:DUF4386 domain-containing protein n=1 Tax=Shewanella corallii TaxID=560080 RepID=A0ABT0N818_9GAMM|nr:DUF6796 family protein [Shewanella corallii]MCL2914011.1 hypothetical protein [Shewanella corallii]